MKVRSLLLITKVLLTQLLFSQNIEKHILESTFVEESRTVRVWLPEEYDSSQKYATIYVFDGSYLFNAAWANVEFLTWYRKIPNAIVVAVHFKEDNRNFDMAMDFWGTGELYKNGMNFYKYTINDLIPFIAKTYSTSGHKTIIGHSQSSTFLNYFLFDKDKPVFNNYIALSQIFIGDYKKDITKLIETEIEFPINYFTGIALGDAEVRVSNPKNVEKLLDSLPKNKNFSYKFEEFPTSDHGSLYPDGLPNALKYVFKDFTGASSNWTYNSKLNTYIHNQSKISIATHFDNLKIDPLTYFIAQRKKASDIYNIEIKLTPEDETFVAMYGIEKKDEKYIDRVVEYFEKQYPNDNVLLQCIAQNYRSIGSWEKMEAYFWKYNELPEIKGKQKFAYNYLFSSFDRFMKNPDKAWDLLDKYKIAFPKYKSINRLYGKISVDYNYKLKKGEKALLQYLKETSSNKKSQESGYLLLGKLYKLQGKIEKAKKQFDKVLKLNPSSSEAKQLIGNL